MVNVFTVLVLLLAWTGQSGEPASLVLRSQAGADVYWEGKLVGRTGQDGVLRLSGMPYGSYVIEISKEGYKRRKVEVELEAAPQELAVRLELLAASETAVSPPPGARSDSGAPAPSSRQSAVSGRSEEGELRQEAGNPDEAGEEDNAGLQQPIGQDHESVSSEAVNPPVQDIPPPSTPDPAARTETQTGGGVADLLALGWWWLALPVLVLGWLLWRRRWRADRRPLIPARPRVPRDPDLEAFARTLSPAAGRRQTAEPAPADGDEKK